MTDIGWSLTSSRLAAVTFVEWLEVNDGRPDNFIDQYGLDPDRAWRTAEDAGWVETIERPAHTRRVGERRTSFPRVTGAGHSFVEEVARLRESRVARSAACRQGLLLWVYNARPAGTGQFLEAEDFRFYGTSFTAEEVREAVRYLRERELLTGSAGAGGALLRPALTAGGIDLVENHDADLRALGKQSSGRGPVYQQNFHGPISGQVAQGANVQQTQHQDVDLEALARVFTMIRESLVDISDPALRGDAEDAVSELETAAETGDTAEVQLRAGKLQRLVGLIGSTAVTTATSTGTTELLALMGAG